MLTWLRLVAEFRENGVNPSSQILSLAMVQPHLRYQEKHVLGDGFNGPRRQPKRVRL